MNATNSLPDAADRAFAEFFRTQVPSPWPDCPIPAERATTARPASDLSWSSRAALAASVALLLGLGIAFSSGVSPAGKPAPNGDLLGGATADGKGLLKHLDPAKDFPAMP